MMIQRTLYSLVLILFTAFVLQAQQPFAALDKAVKDEQGGWAGNKERLSTVFDAERKRLGDNFDVELLKWLGNDPEKHDWISYFLESESYLHGNKRLPHLSLLVKEQGLALVRDRDDEESRYYTMRFSVTAAILSSELGFGTLASSYKNEAEGLFVRHPELESSIPASSESDFRRYDGIESVVKRKKPLVSADPNSPPKFTVSGGVLGRRALNNVKPSYPKEAREAGASGQVTVQVVLDETGKVIWVRTVSGHPLLRQPAEAAAWETKFAPTNLSGKLVKVFGVLLYNFPP